MNLNTNTEAATRKALGPNEPCWCGSGTKYKRCHREADAEAARSGAVKAEQKRLRPGKLSPPRAVPPHIPRPDYAFTGRPANQKHPAQMDGERLARMRRACKAAAEILRDAGKAVQPGVTTDALDALVHEACIAHGGYPSPLNYRGFPKSLCTSVNEVICHGIPDDRPLEDGDIINLDVTIFLEGMHGDTNGTFLVGEVDEESRRLVRVTHECMMRGIEAVKPGAPLNVIGKAIEAHATAHGLGVVRSYCGHGINEQFHTSLQVPHFYDPGATTRLEPGMTFTIEPMITLGTWKDRIWDDDWTAVTADGRRAAQFEHTVLVTDQGVEILSQP